MNPTPDHNERLERMVGDVLKGLPPRRAPQSLERRVLAEIGRRAALPWWRRSFAHCPIAARAAFLALCLGIVKVVIMATVWIMAGFDTAEFHGAFAARLTWMESGFAMARAVVEFFEIVLRNIPPLWLYGGLAFFATLYAALFGLGAAAYRTLYASR